MEFRKWFENEVRESLLSKRLAHFGRSLKPGQRVSMSPYPDEVDSGDAYLTVSDKPTGGIWYGCGNSWINWMTSEMPHLAHPYVHEITVDVSRVYSLKSQEDYEAFTKTFGYNKKWDWGGTSHAIDWREVAKTYAGLECCAWYDKVGWLRAWDVPSGVVWDTSAILKHKLIAQMDRRQKKFVAPDTDWGDYKGKQQVISRPGEEWWQKNAP
jgi:hypothetical protein